MNAFQKCQNTSDAVPLYLPQQLYLKPVARINITVYLPQKLIGKAISNWELMEKLRSMITPNEFTVLKVAKCTLEFIRFEGEVDDKNTLDRVISKLDNKMIKLKEFHDMFKTRALESRPDFPNKHIWDSFFRDAKDMNEMKSGERPDTVHISNLPIRWFVPYHLSGEEDLKPSEKIFYRIFEKFGHIRYVDIPICDPYRKQMKTYMSGLQTFSFDEKDFFEGYVQFKDYIGFTKTMDAFRGMKLLHKDDEYNEIYTVSINVDFDKTKHMSEASIKRREIVRERLKRKEKLQEEKEKQAKEEKSKKEQAERQKEIDLKNEKERRRREREEKRKTKILSQLKVKGADEINDKIAKEEKRLLKAQRKLEAIRLVEELFQRIKNKQESDILPIPKMTNQVEDELTRFKTSSELIVHSQREKLHRAIEGRAVLKTILSKQSRHRSASSSSDTSLSIENAESTVDNKPIIHQPNNMYSVDTNWYSYQSHINPYINALYHPVRGHPSFYPYPPRGRGATRGGGPGPSRGPGMFKRRRAFHYRGRGRGGGNYYPPELQEEYYRYFQKFLHDNHSDRELRSYSRSRSRSRSRSMSRSRSYSRYRSPSRRSRSRRRSYSKSRKTYSRSRSRERRTSYRRSRSYSRSRSRSKSRTKRSRTRSRSHRTKSKTRSRSRSKERRKSRSLSCKSIDSSKFISPNRLRNRRSRSWSFPNDNSKSLKQSAWSKTPSP